MVCQSHESCFYISITFSCTKPLITRGFVSVQNQIFPYRDLTEKTITRLNMEVTVTLHFEKLFRDLPGDSK